MSKEWINVWIYGYKTVLEQVIESKKIEDDDGNKVLPAGHLLVGPVYPHEQVGVDDDGNPVYKRKGGSVKCLWLVSIYGEREELIKDREFLECENYVVHVDETVDRMRELYPAMTLGTAIPYIC